MNCKVCRVEIEEGEAGQLLSGAAQAHLDVCGGCRLFRDERFKLRALMSSLESVNAPADFDFRLRARLANERVKPQSTRWIPSFAPSVQAIALAAVFVLLVSATAVFRGIVPVSKTVLQTESVATMTPVETASPISSELSSVSNNSVNVDEVREGISDEASPMMTGSRNPMSLNVASRAFSKPSLRHRTESSESAALRALVADYNAGNVRRDGREQLIPLAVNSSAQSARVLLEDGRGSSRVVSLEPVTFGAQEMIERKPATRLVSSNSRGIW